MLIRPIISIEGSTTSTHITEQETLIKALPAPAADSYEYSDEDSYMYSDEVGVKNTTQKGELLTDLVP